MDLCLGYPISPGMYVCMYASFVTANPVLHIKKITLVVTGTALAAALNSISIVPVTE